MKIEQFLKTILESKVDGEEELEKLLAKAELTEEESTQVKIALRALDGIRDKVPDEIMGKLMEMLGATPVAAAGHNDDEPTEEEKLATAKALVEAAEKADKLAKGANPAGLVLVKSDGTADFSAVPESSRALVEQLWKSNAEKDARVEKLSKSHDELLDSIQTERFEKTAAESYSHVPGGAKEIAGVLKGLAGLDVELGKRVAKILTSTEALLKRNNVFSEVGKDGLGGDGGGSTMEQIETLAAEFRKDDPKLTKAASIKKVMEVHPGLYAQQKAERRSAH